MPSIAPTLPNGAERMLGQLRPNGDDDEEDIQDGNQDIGHHVDSQRPQFVLGAEVDDEDHHDHQHEHGSPAGQTVIDESTKGWREVA